MSLSPLSVYFMGLIEPSKSMRGIYKLVSMFKSKCENDPPQEIAIAHVPSLTTVPVLFSWECL